MAAPKVARADFYRILEVSSDATFDEIRASYKRLILNHHPDKAGNTPENNEKFARIREAYETLSDPRKRKAYDEYRKRNKGHLKTPGRRWTRRRYIFIEEELSAMVGKISRMSENTSKLRARYLLLPDYAYQRGIIDLLDGVQTTTTKFKSDILHLKNNLRRDEGSGCRWLYLRYNGMLAHMQVLSCDVEGILEELKESSSDSVMLLRRLNDVLEMWEDVYNT